MTNHATKILPLVDTHAHLDMAPFQDDLDSVLVRCWNGSFPSEDEKSISLSSTRFEMKAIIVPGVNVTSAHQVLEITKRSPRLYPALAIHPNYTSQVTNEQWQLMEELAQDERLVAIGETGLDRHWDYSSLDVQIDFFWRHIRLAQKRNLPLLIHCREAQAELMPILREAAAENETGRLRGVLHSFSGDAEMAAECVELGLHLAFSGSLTYSGKKSVPVCEAAKTAPLKRLLLETDAPFLTPFPFRGKLEKNEPLLTAFIAKKLAELRETTVEEIAQQTTQNAFQLFGID